MRAPVPALVCLVFLGVSCVSPEELNGRDRGTVTGTARIFWDGSRSGGSDGRERFTSGVEVAGDLAVGDFTSDQTVTRPDYSLMQASLSWRGGVEDPWYYVHGIAGLAYSRLNIDNAPNIDADEADVGLGLGFQVGARPWPWLSPYLRGTTFGGFESESGQIEVGVEVAPVESATLVIAYRYWDYEIEEFDLGFGLGQDVDLEIDGLLLGFAARF